MLVVRGFNSTRHTCKACGESFYGSGRYCCECLSQLNRPGMYSDANYMIQGIMNKDFCGISIEFETASKTAEEQLELKRWGFIPTSDSSINGIEWKSPIYGNFKSFRYAVDFIETLLVDRPGLIDGNCGTHVHVGVPDKDELCHNWLYGVLEPITRYMLSTPEKTRAFWGRWFNSYATAELDFGDHYSWVNINTRYETLEWRLPVFVTARQFYRMARWCAEITAWLWNNRNRSAEAVANKLLKKYKEAVASV